jgi:hypothetical protein
MTSQRPSDGWPVLFGGSIGVATGGGDVSERERRPARVRYLQPGCKAVGQGLGSKGPGCSGVRLLMGVARLVDGVMRHSS